MPDYMIEVAEKIVAGMSRKAHGVCPDCGHDVSEGITFFECESCGRLWENSLGLHPSKLYEVALRG
ncbi:MAG: hypothetical protein ACFFEA_04090 [Candidatus Thorarchaeota archaeon]